MVHRSILVYDLLRNEQSILDGFSKTEILTRIRDKYDIAVSKTLRRDVALALRRGLDFGILTKKRHKFRFEPDFEQTINLERNIARGVAGTKERKRRRKKKATDKSVSTRKGRRRQQQQQQQRRQRRRRSPARSRKRSVPRPKLPRPPSWSPKRRNLTEEPVSKFIRHS